MFVYVLMVDLCQDGERSVQVDGVFKSNEDAKIRLVSLGRLSVVCFDTILSSGDCISMYDEGFYNDNHLDIWIEKQELI